MAPTSLVNLCSNLQQILRRVGQSTQDSIKQQLQQELSHEELHESRKTLFSLAEAKHYEESQSQHGRSDDHNRTQGTNIDEQLILKARPSVEAIIDDIIELYLYITGKRSKFPKTCLSSSKLKTNPNMESMIMRNTKENVNIDIVTTSKAATEKDDT